MIINIPTITEVNIAVFLAFVGIPVESQSICLVWRKEWFQGICKYKWLNGISCRQMHMYKTMSLAVINKIN